MHRIECPSCAHKLKYGDEHTGKKVKCQKCGISFRLPVSAENGLEERPVVFSQPSSSPQPAEVEPPPQPPPPRVSRYDRKCADLGEEFFMYGGISGAAVGGVVGLVASFIPKDEFRPISLTVLGGFVGYWLIAFLSAFVILPIYVRLVYGKQD